MRKLVETKLNYNLGNKKEIFEFFFNKAVKVSVDGNNRSIKRDDNGFIMKMMHPTVFRKSYLTDLLFQNAKGYDVVKDENEEIVELIIK
jgi:hypothetical protein